MNRRVPNGMHGGVEGGLITRPSDCIIVCQALNIVISVMQLLVAQIQTKIGCDNNKFPVCYK